MRVTDVAGKMAEAVKSVRVVAPELTAEIRGPAELEPGQSSTFVADVSSGTCPCQYRWNFDDGSTSKDEKPSHSYRNKGIYTISLTVKDSQNKVDDDSFTVTVKFGEPIGLTLDLRITSQLSENKILFYVTTNPAIEREITIQRSNLKPGNWATATSITISSSGSGKVTWDLDGINIDPQYFRAYFPGDSSYKASESTIVGPVSICPRVNIC